MSQEDLEWFKSTFRPIPKPQLPEDAIEYSLYLILSDHPPTPTVTDAIAETRSRLQEIQKSASELTKSLLKNYIWQREGFSLEVVKEDGSSSIYTAKTESYIPFRNQSLTWKNELRRFNRGRMGDCIFIA